MHWCANLTKAERLVLRLSTVFLSLGKASRDSTAPGVRKLGGSGLGDPLLLVLYLHRGRGKTLDCSVVFRLCFLEL